MNNPWNLFMSPKRQTEAANENLGYEEEGVHDMHSLPTADLAYRRDSGEASKPMTEFPLENLGNTINAWRNKARLDAELKKRGAK